VLRRRSRAVSSTGTSPGAWALDVQRYLLERADSFRSEDGSDADCKSCILAVIQPPKQVQIEVVGGGGGARRVTGAKGNERVERRPYVPVGWTSRRIGVRFEPVDVLEVRQPREKFRPTRVPSEIDRLDQEAERRVHQDRLRAAFRVNRARVDVMIEQTLSLDPRTVQQISRAVAGASSECREEGEGPLTAQALEMRQSSARSAIDAGNNDRSGLVSAAALMTSSWSSRGSSAPAGGAAAAKGRGAQRARHSAGQRRRQSAS